MALVLSHPLRLDVDGSFATVDPDSPAGQAEALVALIGTRYNERPLAPTFGLSDPTFATVDAGELGAQVAIFGPAVNITGVDTTVTDGVATVVVTFD